MIFAEALKGHRWAIKLVMETAQDLGPAALETRVSQEEAREALRQSVLKAFQRAAQAKRDNEERAAALKNPQRKPEGSKS